MANGQLICFKKDGSKIPALNLPDYLTIGSGLNAGIRIKNNPDLDFIVCTIKTVDGLAILEKESTNPVLLNGKLLNSSTILKHEDKFEISGKIFQYYNKTKSDEITKMDVQKVKNRWSALPIAPSTSGLSNPLKMSKSVKKPMEKPNIRKRIRESIKTPFRTSKRRKIIKENEEIDENSLDSEEIIQDNDVTHIEEFQTSDKGKTEFVMDDFRNDTKDKGEISETRKELKNEEVIKLPYSLTKVQKGPKNDLTDVRGVRQLLQTPKKQKEPENDLTDVRGVRQLLQTPKKQKEPENDLTDVRGVKQLLQTPRIQKEPENNLSNVKGVKQMLQTPKIRKEPENDLTDVEGVKNLLGSPETINLDKEEIFNRISLPNNKKILRTYGRKSCPLIVNKLNNSEDKIEDPKESCDINNVRVKEWIKEQSLININGNKEEDKIFKINENKEEEEAEENNEDDDSSSSSIILVNNSLHVTAENELLINNSIKIEKEDENEEIILINEEDTNENNSGNKQFETIKFTINDYNNKENNKLNEEILKNPNVISLNSESNLMKNNVEIMEKTLFKSNKEIEDKEQILKDNVDKEMTFINNLENDNCKKDVIENNEEIPSKYNEDKKIKMLSKSNETSRNDVNVEEEEITDSQERVVFVTEEEEKDSKESCIQIEVKHNRNVKTNVNIKEMASEKSKEMIDEESEEIANGASLLMELPNETLLKHSGNEMTENEESFSKCERQQRNVNLEQKTIKVTTQTPSKLVGSVKNGNEENEESKDILGKITVNVKETPKSIVHINEVLENVKQEKNKEEILQRRSRKSINYSSNKNKVMQIKEIDEMSKETYSKHERNFKNDTHEKEDIINEKVPKGTSLKRGRKLSNVNREEEISSLTPSKLQILGKVRQREETPLKFERKSTNDEEEINKISQEISRNDTNNKQDMEKVQEKEENCKVTPLRRGRKPKSDINKKEKTTKEVQKNEKTENEVNEKEEIVIEEVKKKEKTSLKRGRKTKEHLSNVKEKKLDTVEISSKKENEEMSNDDVTNANKNLEEKNENTRVKEIEISLKQKIVTNNEECKQKEEEKSPRVIVRRGTKPRNDMNKKKDDEENVKEISLKRGRNLGGHVSKNEDISLERNSTNKKETSEKRVSEEILPVKRNGRKLKNVNNNKDELNKTEMTQEEYVIAKKRERKAKSEEVLSENEEVSVRTPSLKQGRKLRNMTNKEENSKIVVINKKEENEETSLKRVRKAKSNVETKNDKELPKKKTPLKSGRKRNATKKEEILEISKKIHDSEEIEEKFDIVPKRSLRGKNKKETQLKRGNKKTPTIENNKEITNKKRRRLRITTEEQIEEKKNEIIIKSTPLAKRGRKQKKDIEEEEEETQEIKEVINKTPIRKRDRKVVTTKNIEEIQRKKIPLLKREKKNEESEEISESPVKRGKRTRKTDKTIESTEMVMQKRRGRKVVMEKEKEENNINKSGIEGNNFVALDDVVKPIKRRRKQIKNEKEIIVTRNLRNRNKE